MIARKASRESVLIRGFTNAIILLYISIVGNIVASYCRIAAKCLILLTTYTVQGKSGNFKIVTMIMLI